MEFGVLFRHLGQMTLIFTLFQLVIVQGREPYLQDVILKISVSFWISYSRLPQPVGLLKLILKIFLHNDI